MSPCLSRTCVFRVWSATAPNWPRCLEGDKICLRHRGPPRISARRRALYDLNLAPSGQTSHLLFGRCPMATRQPPAGPEGQSHSSRAPFERPVRVTTLARVPQLVKAPRSVDESFVSVYLKSGAGSKLQRGAARPILRGRKLISYLQDSIISYVM